MDKEKLKQQLNGLLARATLKPEEEKDDGRVNEARTCAYLFLKKCAEHGVKLKMVLPQPAPKPYVPPPAPPPQPDFRPRSGPRPSSTMHDDFADSARYAYDVNMNMDPSFVEEFFGPNGPFKDVYQKARENQAKRDKAARDAAEEVRRREEQRRREEGWAKKGPDIGDAFQRPNNPRTKQSSKPGAPPIIVSQYESICLTCKKKIKPGERCWWVKSVGCSHEDCGYEDLQRVAG